MTSGETRSGALAPRTEKSHRWIAMLWGFAEATVFFIVPDVWLTRTAVRHGLKPALVNCAFSLIGALAGGVLVWLLAKQGMGPDIARFFDALPGISPAMIEHARASLEQQGPPALAYGAMTGVPYKLYALHAASLLSLPAFLLVSAVARLARFVVTSCGAWLVVVVLKKHLQPSALLWLHALAWLAFYAFYFNVHRG
jgi:membrane protein YqaA with SNARE-associated domain